MIPYEELVHALADWRARQGLGPAPTRSARVSATTPAVAAPPARTGYTTGSAAAIGAPPPRSGYTTGAAAAIAPAAAGADDFDGGGTEIREDSLADEIDVDAEAVDVLEEQFDEE